MFKTEATSILGYTGGSLSSTLRYKVENGVYGILPSLSRVSKQLGRVLGDLGVFRATFACLIAGHCWTDGFNPATDSVGGTVDESPVVISKIP